MRCTACGAQDTEQVGMYRPYSDYDCFVHDCLVCGARFAQHDGSIYEKLHSTRGSPYDVQWNLAEEIVDSFRRDDLAALRVTFSRLPKQRFVIDTLQGPSRPRNLLEVGCSTGYLASYFLAAGDQVLGVDVSPSAIAKATSLFGPHFAVAGSDAVLERAPYDAIYHVGTVGCVDEPATFTRDLLDLLRPDGRLVFNAPNVLACRRPGELWGASTPPPDLVALFDPDYWWTRFSDVADVDVVVAEADPYQELIRRLHRFRIGSRRMGQPPKRLLNSDAGSSSPDRPARASKHPILRPAAKGLASVASALHLLPRTPAQHGIHVVMRKTAQFAARDAALGG